MSLVISCAIFKNTNSNSGTLIGRFSLSISGQTHELIVYCRKQISVSFLRVCPVFDSYFDNVKTKFMFSNRTNT